MQENNNGISKTNSDINTKPKLIINKPSQYEVRGAAITWLNRAMHLRTKKHNDALYINHIKFEIK